MTFALRILAAFLAAAAFMSGAARAALPIEHWTTPNGARVYFVRADSIPMLDVSLDFDAGSRLDPAGRAGLSSIANAMLARGAGGLDESAISEGFARIGAQRGGGAGDDRASVNAAHADQRTRARRGAGAAGARRGAPRLSRGRARA